MKVLIILNMKLICINCGNFTYFETEVHMSIIQVSAAEAKVPEQDFSESDSMEVETDGKNLISANVEEGVFHLSIYNGIGITSELAVTMFNIVDAFGNPRIENATIFANSDTTIEVDLGGYSIQNYPDNGEPVTHFYYEVYAETRSTENDPDPFVEVTSEDAVTVEFTMDSAYVSYFEGDIDRIDVDIDPIEKKDLLDLAEVEGDVRLEDLVLTFNLYNEIDFMFIRHS